MDQARLALDFIDTLAWPAAVVGLVAFFLVRFRESVGGLLDRIQEVKGPAGTGFTAPAAPTGQSPIEPDKDELRKGYETYYVLYQFERIYRVIYGTQLTFMLAFLVDPNRTLPEVSLTPAYDLHVQRTEGEVNYTVPTREVYVSFLISSGMITRDDQARTYQLTDWGSAFLNYINQQGMSYAKAY